MDCECQSQSGESQCDRATPRAGALLSAFLLAALPQGASVNENKAPREGRCLAPSKGPFKAKLSLPPTQELPDQLKLLSSPHTLKVRLLANPPDGLEVKEKAFLIVCVTYQHFVECILSVCMYILFSI